MSNSKRYSRLASRAAANLVAIAAVSAIFGFKAAIDASVRDAESARIAAAQIAVASAYDPYFTEQP